MKEGRKEGKRNRFFGGHKRDCFAKKKMIITKETNQPTLFFLFSKKITKFEKAKNNFVCILQAFPFFPRKK